MIDESLRPLIRADVRRSEDPDRRIYRMCLAGNTTMNHLLLGLYAEPVRMEPYIPSFLPSRRHSAPTRYVWDCTRRPS